MIKSFGSYEKIEKEVYEIYLKNMLENFPGYKIKSLSDVTLKTIHVKNKFVKYENGEKKKIKQEQLFYYEIDNLTVVYKSTMFTDLRIIEKHYIL